MTVTDCASPLDHAVGRGHQQCTPGCGRKLSGLAARHYGSLCEVGGPSPGPPPLLLPQHSPSTLASQHPERPQHTPLRPVPLTMQRSPAWSPVGAPGTPRAAAAATPQRTTAPTPSKFVPYTGDLYVCEGELGKGAFGLVTRMRSVITGELVAMKTIERARLFTAVLRKTVEREVRIHKAVRHAAIVRLLEVIETPRSLHLVLEHMGGGTLQQRVEAHGRLSEAAAAPLVWQILGALAHLHSCHVCHRDLKLENLLLDPAGTRVKLIDFGLSIVWRPGGVLRKAYGTPCYMAPEIVARRPYDGAAVDVWSLGVCVACMLAARLPFTGRTRAELRPRILAGVCFEGAGLPAHLSAPAKALVGEMLAVDPQRRATVRHAQQHAWLAAAADAAADATAAAAAGATACGDEAPPPPEAAASSPCARSPACGTPPPAAAAAAAMEPPAPAGPPSPPGSPQPTPPRPESEPPLDAAALRTLAARGVEPREVVWAVRARAFSHEAACYEMLLLARQRERDAADGAGQA